MKNLPSARLPERARGAGKRKRRAAARAGAVRKDAAPARGKGRRRPKVGRRRAFGVVAAANHGPRAPLRCDGSGKRRAAARAGGVRKGVTATAGEKGGRPKVGRRRAFGVVAAANHGPRAPLRCDGSGKRRAAARAGGVREGVTATAREKGGRRPDENGGADGAGGSTRTRDGYLSAAGPSGGVSAGSNAASNRASASVARRPAGGATVSISASAAR